MEKLDDKGTGGDCLLLMQCCALMHKSLDQDESISSVLSLIGNKLEASRVGFFVMVEPEVIYRAYDWSREKGFASLGTSDIFLEGEAASYSFSIAEPYLYDETDILFFERKLLADYGVILENEAKSMLVLPLEYGGQVKGFIEAENIAAAAVHEHQSSLIYLPSIVLAPVVRRMENEAFRKESGILSENKILYELTMENVKILAFETDLAKNVTVVVDSPYSRRFMKDSGFPKVMQDPVSSLSSHMDSEGKRGFSSILAEVRKGGENASCTVKFYKRTEEDPSYIKISMYGIPGTDGRVSKIYTIFQDVSDYLKSEELLQAENERAKELKKREDELSALRNKELELLQKHKAALDSLEFILWEIDLYAGTTVPIDSPFFERCRKIYGLPKDNAEVAYYLYGLMDEGDQIRVKKMFSVLRQGRLFKMDLRIPLGKDGTERVMRISATPSKSSAGDWDSAVATSYDITDQVVKTGDYEQELAYFHLSRSSGILMSAHVNLSMNSFLESTPEIDLYARAMSYDEMVGRGNGFSAVLADGRSAVEIFDRSNLLKEWTAGRTKFSYTMRFKGQNQVQWVRTDFRLQENPNTKDIEFFCYVIDVTKDELMSRLLNRLGDVIYEFIAVINPAEKSICLIGSPEYEDLKYIDYYQYVENEIERHLLPIDSNHSREQYDIENIQKELARDSHYSNIIPWRSPDGEPIRKMAQYFYLDPARELILYCITDVTEQYRQEQIRLQEVEDALRRADVANRAKSEFVSRISHDIRTPIGAVLNLTQFAEEDIDKKDKLADDLAKIKTSGRFLLSLINDVLDISKIDSGKIELVPEPCSYEGFIEEISSLLESMCCDKGLDCIINAAPPVEKAFMADKVRLNQVTLNLLSNSVKYTPAGGAVSFFVDQERLPGGKVSMHICVADNGIGMTEEFQRKMFDEFTQDSKNPLRDKTTPGTGLGLSIVNKMVQLMGGQIKVESEVGKGSSFLISIPMKTADEKDVKDSSKKKSSVGDAPVQATVLLAEDNMINTEIAIRIFTKMGVTVEHAENGEEALNMFSASEAGHYDAIFMDIQMPKMDGYGATHAIRALGRPDAVEIPIIAMTANAFADAVQKAKDAGMDEYITKPLDPERLREILLEQLEKGPGA
ncbi:MAG: response regulator [Treponema sp.]|nr:response regulator [Treponema sp.]